MAVAPEENLVFQNGLHDLQVRKNRATLDGDEAETKAVDAQLKRAEPLLRRLQAELNQGDRSEMQTPAALAARTAARRAESVNHVKQLGLAVHNYHSVYHLFSAVRDLWQRRQTAFELACRLASLPGAVAPLQEIQAR